MTRHYQVLGDCLRMLKALGLSGMQELKLEVQLIQAKRFLLSDEVTAYLRKDKHCDCEFEDFYKAFSSTCHPGCGNGPLLKLSKDLQKLTENLRLSVRESHPN